jgi:hypothetical protein
MTLPFRRRHHDDESAHDRARATWSHAMLEPIKPVDASWLDAHLAGCGECHLERESFLDDRQLLRSLRDQAPEPPRDLWARTAAAIEQESARRSRHGALPLVLPDRLVPRRARLPLGVMAGLLVVIVVVATSLAPRGIPLGTVPAGSAVAIASPPIVPSPIAVQTATLGWLQAGTDGTYQLLLAHVNQVCPDVTSGCAPLQDARRTSLKFATKPQSIVGSPDNDQVVVVAGSSGSGAGSVLVVPVPTGPAPTGPAPTGPNPTAGPTGTPSATPTASAAPSPTPSAGASPEATPGGAPQPTPQVSPQVTPQPTPPGARAIAEGVTVVGGMVYSPDGSWLAFSARLIGGTTGPDLYLWKVGSPAAEVVTSDHATFFSGWYGNRILASRVISTSTGAPITSGAPSTEPSAAPPAGTSSPSPSLAVEAHPVSFLFDPVTRGSQDLAGPDIWLPSVDPSGRFATYWLGTVAPDAAGTGWVPATGRLVLDGWTAPLEPVVTPAPAGAPGPVGSPGASAGAPRAAPPGPSVGPAGTPVDLVDGPLSAFDARFDPTGIRLAVWVADSSDPMVGTLRLVVLDQAHGRIAQNLTPLPSVAALRGFSIGEGRLAWVTPPGQNGNQSVVQVLAWSADSYGQIETLPAGQPFIVH